MIFLGQVYGSKFRHVSQHITFLPRYESALRTDWQGGSESLVSQLKPLQGWPISASSCGQCFDGTEFSNTLPADHQAPCRQQWLPAPGDWLNLSQWPKSEKAPQPLPISCLTGIVYCCEDRELFLAACCFQAHLCWKRGKEHFSKCFVLFQVPHLGSDEGVKQKPWTIA